MKCQSKITYIQKNSIIVIYLYSKNKNFEWKDYFIDKEKKKITRYIDEYIIFKYLNISYFNTLLILG